MTSDEPKTDVSRGRAERTHRVRANVRRIHRQGPVANDVFFHLVLRMYIGTNVMYMPGVSRPFVGLSSDLISFRIAAYIPDSSVQAAAMETGLTGFNGASQARVRDGRTCDRATHLNVYERLLHLRPLSHAAFVCSVHTHVRRAPVRERERIPRECKRVESSCVK